MDIELLREYCIVKSGVTESLPFGPDTLVFKVGGKVFLLISLNTPTKFNVKCDPERAVALREEYTEIVPGFHMNKKHWNTVSFEGRLSDNLLRELIDHSYDLVYKSLPAKIKESIKDEEE